MLALHNLERFATTVNDIDDHFPKSRGRCFDIGTWGGCGALCPAFTDGECTEPQEISPEDVLYDHDEFDSKEIFKKYKCFDHLV